MLYSLTKISKKLWGEVPINTVSGWDRSFSPSDLAFSDRNVVSIKGFDIGSMTDDTVMMHSNKIYNCFKNLYPKQSYKIVCLNREGTARVCPPKHHPRKAEFLKEYEQFINSSFNIRHRSVYMLFDKDENVTSQIHDAGLSINKTAKSDFYWDLSFFFGGTPEAPFFYPIEKWKHGVKIGQRYGATLMHLSSVGGAVPFQHHIFNYLTDDCIATMSFMYPTMFETEQKLTRLYGAMKNKQSAASKETEQELEEMIKEISLGRGGLVYLTSTLTIFANSQKEAVKRAKSLSTLLRNHGLSYEIEGTVEFDAFMYLFNSRYNDGEAKFLSLARKYPFKIFTRLLPFSTGFKGAPEGELFINDSSEPVYIDPYHTSSPHCTGLGHTGSGKSMLAQYRDLYCDLLVVIEKIQEDEGSYRVSTPFFGGAYSPISIDRPLSVNCFGKSINIIDSIKFLEDIGYHYSDFAETDIIKLRDFFANAYDTSVQTITKDALLEEIGKYKNVDYIEFKIKEAKFSKWPVSITIDREKLAFVVSILTLMVAGSEKSASPELFSLLEHAALQAYESNPEGMTLGTTAVYNILGKMDEKHLAARIRSFTKMGRYGLLFDKECDMGSGDAYYELRISDDEVLLPGIISILYHSLKTFSHPNHFGKRKKIRLDESWFFTKHPILSRSSEEMIRTYRKKGIELDFDSQMAADFAGISGQCEHNFFLYNKPESLPDIQSAFQLTAEEKSILQGIKPPKEYNYAFSRLYLRSTYGKGVLQCIPSREFYWLATTNPADKVKREQYKIQTNDIYTAIKKLAAEGN